MVELSSLRGSRRDSGVVSDGQLLTQEEIEQEIQKRLVVSGEIRFSFFLDD